MGGRTMLYVSCGETQEILHFDLDVKNGVLRKTGTTRLPGAPEPGLATVASGMDRMRSTGAPLTAHPARQVLYAALRTSPCRLLSFRIAPQSGELALIAEAPIPDGTVYIATDRAGHWLLGAAYHSNSIWVSRIGADGSVEESPAQLVEPLVTPHSVALHPDNRVAYAGATGMPGIQVFDFDGADRPLTARAAAPASLPNSTPRHLAIDPAGRFLFAMNETSSIIDVFAIDRDGRGLTLAHSADLRPEDQRDAHGLGADIKVSNDGRFLYGCERKRGTVNVFAIDRTNGALEPLQTVEVGFIPRSLALDPSGRYFASAIQGDGVIQLHAVSPNDGRLTHCATYETGGTPIWVEFVNLR